MSQNSDAEPVTDLIHSLLLEARRLMEDESAALALALPDAPALLAVQVARLHQAATDLLTLAAAAKALAARIDDRTSPA